MTEKEMLARLHANGLPEDALLAERLCGYLAMLLDWNTRIDLIAPTGEEEAADRHLMDSLTILNAPGLMPEGSVIDVGTGAGLPGLVLAIARPEQPFMLVDALRKRVDFLNAVAEKLDLRRVTVLHARAEDAARKADLREGFDLAVARAVAPLNVLAEYLLPFVKPGGRAVCWKGPSVPEELQAGRRAAFLCGGSLGEAVPAPVAGRDWQHVLVPIEKNGHTPKTYPRKAGTAVKKPLGI